MFQSALGESTFSKGLRYYLQSRQHNFATSENFYESLQTALDEDFHINLPDVAVMMKTWESQSGFPYVSVTRNGNVLKLEQNRFMYGNRSSNNLWWIPINYVVGSNPNFTATTPDLWMPGIRTVTIQGSAAPKEFTPNDWIIVNVQQSGFYRVNYDDILWNLIIEELNRGQLNRINILNRAQLIDDSFHLARADLINYDIVLKIMNSLKHETDYVPWAAASRANSFLNRWLTGTTLHSRYQKFMRKNVEALFIRLGLHNIDEEEDRTDHHVRIIAFDIACQSQLESCLAETSQRLQMMLITGDALAPDLVAPIYCNGMRSANELIFLGMQNKLLRSTDVSERKVIITGLGCTQNSTLLSRYLQLAVDPEISLTNSERSQILSSVFGGDEASIHSVIEFVSINFREIFGLNFLDFMCSNIAAQIYNQELMTNLHLLLDILYSEKAISQNQADTYRKSSNTIMDWQKAHLRSIENFFETFEVWPTIAPTESSTSSEFTKTDASTTDSELSSTDQPSILDQPTTLGSGTIIIPTVTLAITLIFRHFI